MTLFTRGVLLSALPLAAALSFLSAPGLAAGNGSLCRDDARQERLLCKMECVETYHVAKDECRKVDHACAEACRASRRVCLDLPLAGLAECKEACRETKAAAVAACRETYDAETQAAALDECIDDAQVASFMCRDECREAIDRDEVRTCRKAFRACIRTCPKADGSLD